MFSPTVPFDGFEVTGNERSTPLPWRIYWSWRCLSWCVFERMGKEGKKTKIDTVLSSWAVGEQWLAADDEPYLMDTSIMAKMRYFPNKGTTSDVGGMISTTSKKNTWRLIKIDIESVTCRRRECKEPSDGQKRMTKSKDHAQVVEGLGAIRKHQWIHSDDTLMTADAQNLLGTSHRCNSVASMM